MGFKGKDRHARRLRRLREEAIKAAGRVVYVGSDMVRAEAFRSVSAGSVSGKGHIPSRPGEPPNRDTGVLQAHFTNRLTGPLSAEFRSDAPYALGLEIGTSKVAARPYVRPARDKMEPIIRRLFAQELNKIIKGT